MSVCSCGGSAGHFNNAPGIQHSPKPDREFQIDEQLARLERNINFLGESISNIAMRLNRILLPERPTEGKNETVLSPQTPLAQELSSYNNTIETCVQNLKDITERIEINER